MLSLLYWPIFIAAFYTGFEAYPLWTILALGAAASIVFFIVKPGALEIGLRERGFLYLIIMEASSSAMCAIVFGIGWAAGRALA